VTATGHGDEGAVRLLGAHLNLRETTLTNDSVPALDIESGAVDGNVYFFIKVSAAGRGAGGAVRMFGPYWAAQPSSRRGFALRVEMERPRLCREHAEETCTPHAFYGEIEPSGRLGGVIASVVNKDAPR